MKQPQVSRNHHYVPEWYQHGFLPKGEGEFWVYDKSPALSVECPDGQTRKIKNPRYLRRTGPDKLFQIDDLYAIKFPSISTDFLERNLFGKIDNDGANAAKMLQQWPRTVPLPKGDQYPNEYGDPNERMTDLLLFLNAQKARTPRGLDAIRSSLTARGIDSTNNNFIMLDFNAQRDRLCTVWSEALWQIFSIASDDDAFLLSDEPVVFYNMDCFPASPVCKYPGDPNAFWRGTRVVFPLSSKKLLVLSHKEHADQPSRMKARQMRRNARLYDQTIISFTWIEHEKMLTHDEVVAINFMIKTRATKFVAAFRQEDLFPDRKATMPKWSDLDEIFKPKYPSFHAGSKVHIGYTDGRSAGFNAYGERIPSQADEMRRRLEALLKRKIED